MLTSVALCEDEPAHLYMVSVLSTALASGASGPVLPPSFSVFLSARASLISRPYNVTRNLVWMLATVYITATSHPACSKMLTRSGLNSVTVKVPCGVFMNKRKFTFIVSYPKCIGCIWLRTNVLILLPSSCKGNFLRISWNLCCWFPCFCGHKCFFACYLLQCYGGKDVEIQSDVTHWLVNCCFEALSFLYFDQCHLVLGIRRNHCWRIVEWVWLRP